jgi:glutathione peroxidase-family protein
MASPSEGSGNTNFKQAQSIYDFTALDIDGNQVSLEKYRGHVCVIVNVASK